MREYTIHPLVVGINENDYKCTNATVYVQKKEYDFLLNPHPVDHRYYPDILLPLHDLSIGKRKTIP